MNAKQTLSLALVGAVLSSALSFAPVAVAQEEYDPDQLNCSILPQGICDAANEGSLQNSGLWALLLMAINIMTVGIGIIAVAAIAFAGFLYTSAQNDPAQVKKAIEMIRNTAIGLVVYALMFSAIQFLVPGGVFGTGTDNTPPSRPAPPPQRPGDPPRRE